MNLTKYPRTRHVQGSRLQPGDEDLGDVPFADIAGKHLVIEEKLDGANAGICFDAEGRLHLQSRGHFLTGGEREKHFNLLKAWAAARRDALFAALGTRYVLFGEWLYAKHTIFYDQLPHFFLEFDILDRETDRFLATPRRRALLHGSPVSSVPVLHAGPLRTLSQLAALIGPSLFKSPHWRERAAEAASATGLDVDRFWNETDSSNWAEGLYIKVEDEHCVLDRLKFVRADFLTRVLDSGSHWLKRPIVPNRLHDDADLFEGVP